MVIIHINCHCLVSPIFNEDRARSGLKEYYYNHHRPPGESLIFLDLLHSNAVSHHCHATEQLRRDDVNRTRLYIKVFFNDQQVSQTKDWYGIYRAIEQPTMHAVQKIKYDVYFS